MQVKVTPDGMHAHLILSQSVDDPNPETWNNAIHETLKKAGVVRGIDEKAIRQAVDTALTTHEFPIQAVVANGRKPDPSVDGRIQFYFRLGGKDPSEIAGQHKAPATSGPPLTKPLVKEGTVLAVVQAGARGLDGYTVLGAELPAKPPAEAHVKAGAGVRLLDDGRTCVVAPNTAGYADYVDGTLCVTIPLTVSPDGMEAQLAVHPFVPEGAELDPGDVDRWFAQLGVVHGICSEAVAEAAAYSRQRNVPVRNFVVARGTAPEAGEDGRVEILFAKEPAAGQVAEDNARIDFWERGFLHKVQEGDLLARKIPATPGRAGCDVRGKQIPSVSGKDVVIEAVGDAVVDEKGLECRAAKDGVAVAAGPCKVGVFQEYTIPGDVDLKTGNIHMKGVLTVQGWIRAGFIVQATGDVVVNGGVEPATLEMDANLVVRGGITGDDGSRVKSGGSVSARFIENARVDAGGDVTVTDGILNSHVTAEGLVTATAGKGCIIGGMVRGVRGIDVNELGSVAGQQTIADVGLNAETREKLVELERDCALYERNQRKIAKTLVVLSQKSKLHDLRPEEKQTMARLARYRREIQQKRRTIADYWKRLQEMGASIKVRRAVYEGATVFVFGRRVDIHEDMSTPGEFVFDTEKGHVTYRPQAGQP